MEVFLSSAGRSIIQMARRRTGELVALKLSFCMNSFEGEQQAYNKLRKHFEKRATQSAAAQENSSPLHFLRGQAETSPLLISESIGIDLWFRHEDIFGQRLPPCIVMERGVPLSMRTEACMLDIFEVLKVGEIHPTDLLGLLPVQ